MAADDSTHIIDEESFAADLLADQFLQLFGIFHTVAVADENRLILDIAVAGFLHFFHQSGNGGLQCV